MAVNYSTDFTLIRDDVSAQEWQTRVDLAACYRLVDHYVMSDLIYNHITARIPGTEHLLINLYGLLYREITASSLVKIDLEGNIVWKPNTDYGINVSGYVIQLRGDCRSRCGASVQDRGLHSDASARSPTCSAIASKAVQRRNPQRRTTGYLDRDRFDAVLAKLNEQANGSKGWAHEPRQEQL
jgi:hypothetical protein